MIDDALRLRLIERTPDSGPWPVEYPQTSSVILAVADQTTTAQPTRAGKPRPLPYGAYRGEAELRPSEIQDLADLVGDIMKAAAGLTLKFRVEIELSGDGGQPVSEDRVAALNELLAEVSDDLQLGS